MFMYSCTVRATIFSTGGKFRPVSNLWSYMLLLKPAVLVHSSQFSWVTFYCIMIWELGRCGSLIDILIREEKRSWLQPRCPFSVVTLNWEGFHCTLLRDFSLDFPVLDLWCAQQGSMRKCTRKVVGLHNNNYLLDLSTFSRFVEVGHMNRLHLSLVTTVYL